VHVKSRAPLERQQLASIRAGWTRRSLGCGSGSREMTVVGCCTIAHGKTNSSLDAIFYTESFLDLSESTDMVLLRPVKVKSNAVMIRHNFPYVRRRRIRIHRQSKHLQQIILIFVLGGEGGGGTRAWSGDRSGVKTSANEVQSKSVCWR
jgi:hypothetical protein